MGLENWICMIVLTKQSSPKKGGKNAKFFQLYTKIFLVIKLKFAEQT